jgi:hypothetical protein
VASYHGSSVSGDDAQYAGGIAQYCAPAGSRLQNSPLAQSLWPRGQDSPGRRPSLDLVRVVAVMLTVGARVGTTTDLLVRTLVTTRGPAVLYVSAGSTVAGLYDATGLYTGGRKAGALRRTPVPVAGCDALASPIVDGSVDVAPCWHVPF